MVLFVSSIVSSFAAILHKLLEIFLVLIIFYFFVGLWIFVGHKFGVWFFLIICYRVRSLSQPRDLVTGELELSTMELRAKAGTWGWVWGTAGSKAGHVIWGMCLEFWWNGVVEGWTFVLSLDFSQTASSSGTTLVDFNLMWNVVVFEIAEVAKKLYIIWHCVTQWPCSPLTLLMEENFKV